MRDNSKIVLVVDKMFSGNLIFLAVAILSFDIASGSLDAPLLNQDVRRRDQENGCDNLFFNINVTIQDIGGQCGTNDMALVGEMLQDIAGEIAREIPEKDNERMEAFVCPLPKVGTRRSLRSFDKSQRGLLGYTYKLGGKFTRCNNTWDRRSLTEEISVEAVCGFAEVATLDAKLAAEASRNAGALFRLQIEQATECDDLNEGEKSIAMADASMKAIRKAMRATRRGAKRARVLCQKAKAATSEAELSEYLQNAEKSSTNVMDAAEKVQSLSAQMQGKTDVCNPAIVKGKQDGSVNTPLREWLTTVAHKLSEKISERIINNAAAFGPGCFGEGLDINIGVDGVERKEDWAFWIGTIEDCKNL